MKGKVVYLVVCVDSEVMVEWVAKVFSNKSEALQFAEEVTLSRGFKTVVETWEVN